MWSPPEPAAKGKAKVSHAEATPADVAGAQAALGRITVTPEAQERISAAVLPGSSLIISDEGLHSETGKDTDFIVVMNGEPQGGLMSRHKPSHKEDEWADSFFGGFLARQPPAATATAAAVGASSRSRPSAGLAASRREVQASSPSAWPCLDERPAPHPVLLPMGEGTLN